MDKSRYYFKKVLKREPSNSTDEWALFLMDGYAKFLENYSEITTDPQLKLMKMPENSKQRKDAIIEMHFYGARNTDIAKKLGVSRVYVGKILKNFVNQS
jgi:DNA-directed RNA polymerase specialized sigma subunit